MATTRVWNITDRPGSKIPPTTMIVLGKTLLPGRSVQVDDRELEKAHKLDKEVASGFLAVGQTGPVHHVAAKATLPKGVVRAHGEQAVKSLDPGVEGTDPEEKVVTETVEESGTDRHEGGKHGKKRWER